jgi:hypothetical protein
MENSNFIENDTKVLDFMAMTETGDPEVAKKYLESAKWDVTTAVNAFYSKINVNNNAQRNNININNNNNALNRNLNNNQNNNEEDDGFLSKYIISPISSVFNAIFGSCKEKRDIEREEEERIFRPLPSKIYDSYKFCQFITRKIGIIVFYTANDVHFLNNFISQVSRNSMIMNLLRQYFVLYPLLANTNDGYKMQNAISDSQLKFPSFVFCRNGSFDQNDDVYMNYIFDRTFVINILEGDNTISIESFNKALIDCTEQFGINFANDNSLFPMSDGEILEQQKNDMEELEKQARMKEEQIKKEKLRIQNEKIEEEKKLKEIENKAKEAQKKIVDEPPEGAPDSTTICFRYPDGEKNINRRFLKSHTIKNLYDFVTSLGNEIYSEEGINGFSLYQPFPPKKYTNMENTLEEEGLYPNAVIQIREE